MSLSVIMFNGSPRPNGNTALCLRRIQERLERAAIAAEIVPLAELRVEPCTGCGGCRGKRRCVQEDDLNGLLAKMLAAGGIIIGSHTWFGSVTSWVKNLIDRAGFVARMNDHLFKHKAGTPVIAARRGGAVQVYNQIMSFFAINHFFMVGSSYWNFAFGLHPGEAAGDAEGMQTMDDIADNMAFLLRALESAPRI